MCAGEFGPKIKETSKCDPRHEFPNNHKQKRPTWKPHMKRKHIQWAWTRHQSKVKPSRQIRRIHEDPRAHQSYQTAFRQAMTHIHNMGDHLAVSRPRIGPTGHPFFVGRPTWSADHRSVRLGLIFHVSHAHSMLKSVPGGFELNLRQKMP